MGTPPRWTGRRGRAGEDEADDGAMSKRAVSAVVRLVVPAGAAKPSPPVGPALGQHGVNIMSFCKDFNAKTSEHKAERRSEIATGARRAGWCARRGGVAEGTAVAVRGA